MADLETRARELSIRVRRLTDPGQREALLSRACASEPRLRALVDAMLAAGDAAAPSTEGPRAHATGGPEIPESDEKVGGLLAGRYRLAEQIGEGGMGSVYMAQQTEPVRRLVAVKVIKAGMSSKEVLARFEAERQVLAMMDHPNIARVLDAGATSSGSPFFVMELVKGVPITRFCEERKLSPRERIRLFCLVCHALQHAHQKGIIHRDIKPSNVLVALYDDKPVPKVIDFGVAKAAGQPLTEGTLMTGFGALVGTPEYMSPEQATLNQLDVDTRSDVYSLGVLLYELLTGTTPLGRHTSSGGSLLDLLRAIREVEAPRPSTMISSSATRQDITPAQSLELARLSKLLRGELDWILLKALEKDRARRYESANAFAQDLERYLAGEPVSAVPPSAGYRLRKTLRRHKGKALAASFVAASLIAGLIAFAWQADVAKEQRDVARAAERAEQESRRQADEQRDRAIEAERQTSIRAQELKLVADFQAGMLAQLDPSEAGQRLARDVKAKHAATLAKSGLSPAEQSAARESFEREWSRVNATDTASRLIDETILRPAIATLDEKFKDQPLVDAQLRQVLADRYQQLGLYAAAMPLQERVLEVRRRELGGEHANTLDSMLAMGSLLVEWGRFGEAERFLREVLEQRTRLLPADAPELLATREAWAVLLLDQGEALEAEPHVRAVLEARTRALGPVHKDTITSMTMLAGVLQHLGRTTEAEQVFRDALDKARGALGSDHRITLNLLNNLGTMLQGESRLDEAEKCFSELLGVRRRVSGEDHPDTLVTLGNLGFVLSAQGKRDQAEPLLVESLALRRRVAGEDHPITLFALNDMGELREAQGRATEAGTFFREALERRRRVLGYAHSNTLLSLGTLIANLDRQERYEEAEAALREHIDRLDQELGAENESTLLLEMQLCQRLLRQERYHEAEPRLRELLARSRRALGETHELALGAAEGLAGSLAHLDRVAEAQALMRATITTLRRELGDTHARTLATMHALAQFLQGHEELAEAEALLREELRLRRSLGERDVPVELEALMLLGVNLQYQGRFAEAEESLRESSDGLRERLGPDHVSTRKARLNLVIVLQDLGRIAEAEKLCRELVASDQRVHGPEAEPTFQSTFHMIRLLAALGRAAEFEALADDTFERAKQALGVDHPITLDVQAFVARALLESGKAGPSEACYRDLLQRLRRVRGEDHENALSALEWLGFAVWMQGRTSEAETLVREFLERSTRVHGPEAPGSLIAAVSLGSVLMSQGKQTEAAALLEPLIGRLRTGPPGVPPHYVANALRLLGLSRAGLASSSEDWRAAEALLLEAAELLASFTGLPPQASLEVHSSLADFYDRWERAEPGQGHGSRAAAWRAKTGAPSKEK